MKDIKNTKIPYQRLNVSQWAQLVCLHPEFARRFNKWDKLTTDQWVEIIFKNVALAEKCRCWDSFTPKQWVKLLKCHPLLAEKGDCWDKFTFGDWVWLLMDCPEFANQIKDWDKFNKKENVDCWVDLITRQPQFWSKCTIASEFKSRHWVELLKLHPHLAKYCDWDDLSVPHCVEILWYNPHLGKYCTKFNQFNDSEWIRLFMPEDGFKKLKKYAMQTVVGWFALLKVKPSLANKCDKWEYFDICMWMELIDYDKNFIKRFDKWEQLNSNRLFHFLKRCPDQAVKL